MSEKDVSDLVKLYRCLNSFLKVIGHEKGRSVVHFRCTPNGKRGGGVSGWHALIPVEYEFAISPAKKVVVD